MGLSEANLEDACVVTRDHNGDIHLKQAMNLVGATIE
jgi:uncharacterized membrane protein